MASDFPYSLAPARVPDILAAARSAGTPPKFNNEFLKTALGFSSSNDRAIIKILKTLGFISASGEPTQRYRDFKGPHSGKAVAEGLREGWSELFLSNQQIYNQPVNNIARRVSSITGANDQISQRTANTFKKLCSLADWDDTSLETTQSDEIAPETNDENPAPTSRFAEQQPATQGLLRLHHDVHIHLPATSDAAVYRAVFQALKAELL